MFWVVGSSASSSGKSFRIEETVETCLGFRAWISQHNQGGYQIPNPTLTAQDEMISVKLCPNLDILRVCRR